MIHPLVKLVFKQPSLLSDHAEAYAALIGEEFGRTTSVWKRKALYGVIALSMGGVGVMLGGIAVMLWAVVPTPEMRSPWLLIVVPAVPLLVAIVCGMLAAKKEPAPFEEIRAQIQADKAMLREVKAAA